MDTDIDSYDKEIDELCKLIVIMNKKSQIKSLKKSMRHRKRLTTTKVIIAYIFINCTIVEVYSMVAMWILNDLSALYSLVTAVVSESIAFAVYSAKAYNETKQEEIIKLERDKMLQQENNGEG